MQKSCLTRCNRPSLRLYTPVHAGVRVPALVRLPSASRTRVQTSTCARPLVHAIGRAFSSAPLSRRPPRAVVFPRFSGNLRAHGQSPCTPDRASGNLGMMPVLGIGAMGLLHPPPQRPPVCLRRGVSLSHAACFPVLSARAVMACSVRFTERTSCGNGRHHHKELRLWRTRIAVRTSHVRVVLA